MTGARERTGRSTPAGCGRPIDPGYRARHDAPGPAPRDDAAPDRTDTRVTTRDQSARPQSTDEITDLKARYETDQAELADQETPRSPGRPEHPSELDAANAKVAALEKQLSTVEADKVETTAELDAANTKIDEQQNQLDNASTRIDSLNAKVESRQADRDTDRVEIDSVLADTRARLERLEDPKSDERGSENPLSRVDAPTGAVADGNPVAEEPKTPRTALRTQAVQTAVASGSVFATAMSLGPQVPAYVLAVGVSVAGAVSPAVGWYREWRKVKNADRSEG